MQQAASVGVSVLLLVGVARRIAASIGGESDEWWWDGRPWRQGDDGDNCVFFSSGIAHAVRASGGWSADDGDTWYVGDPRARKPSEIFAPRWSLTMSRRLLILSHSRLRCRSGKEINAGASSAPSRCRGGIMRGPPRREPSLVPIPRVRLALCAGLQYFLHLAAHWQRAWGLARCLTALGKNMFHA